LLVLDRVGVARHPAPRLHDEPPHLEVGSRVLANQNLPPGSGSGGHLLDRELRRSPYVHR
jgi:hypothetical protein